MYYSTQKCLDKIPRTTPGYIIETASNGSADMGTGSHAAHTHTHTFGVKAKCYGNCMQALCVHVRRQIDRLSCVCVCVCV